VTLGVELRERGVGLHVTEQGIDTTTAEGRAMFGMLSVLAELQRELILANTRDGLAAARARGRTGGRRPRLNAEQVALAQKLYDAGDHTVQQIANLFSVPRTTVYGHLDDASKGKRPAIHRKTKSPAAHQPADESPPSVGLNQMVPGDTILTSTPARKGLLRGRGQGRAHARGPCPSAAAQGVGRLARRTSDWPGAAASPALFLDRRAGRLSGRGAHDAITGIAARAGLDDRVTTHVLRHSFATTLVRGGTDLVIAAELLGHARLETTRAYTRPSAEDRRKAVALLPVDE
jgi:hypothetical protein